jgi:hypothetical protein
LLSEKVITTTNYLATMTEFYVKNHYFNYKKDMYKLLNIEVGVKGGTECFERDIFNNITLPEVISNAQKNEKNLINMIPLDDKQF